MSSQVRRILVEGLDFIRVEFDFVVIETIFSSLTSSLDKVAVMKSGRIGRTSYKVECIDPL